MGPFKPISWEIDLITSAWRILGGWVSPVRDTYFDWARELFVVPRPNELFKLVSAKHVVRASLLQGREKRVI